MSKKSYELPCSEHVIVLVSEKLCTSIYEKMNGLGVEEVEDSGYDLSW